MPMSPILKAANSYVVVPILSMLPWFNANTSQCQCYQCSIAMLAIATMPMLPMPTLPIQNAGNFDVAAPNLSVLLTSMPIIKANC